MTGSGFDTPAAPRGVLKALIIAWSSFITAGVASMVFFASFDPVVLAEAATFPAELSRTAGYTIGFLLLWLLTAVGAAMAVYLMESLKMHPPENAEAADKESLQ